MLGFEELKASLTMTKRKVECPVEGCDHQVSRQKGKWRRKKRFKCPEHNIYISPSTFEYQYSIDNLLWHNTEDLDLLNRMERDRRDGGIARDNSEDAVTWNVFRFVDKAHLVAPLLNHLLGTDLVDPEVIYWSYRAEEGSTWSALQRAREEFGEHPRKSSGPDVIINSSQALIFIEPRLIADNATRPDSKKARKEYLRGGKHWFPRVFTSDYQQVAEEDRRFQLMRLWLLGTWMASRTGVDFYLVNLVREGKEEDIEKAFGMHISENQSRRFVRLTWEDIYRYILASNEAGSEKDRMIHYFENKTLGYGRKGMLHKAFHTPNQ